MNKEKLESLLRSEDERTQKLHQIFLDAINEEKLLSHKLKEFEESNPPWSSRMADRLADFGGSWKFILFFLFFMICWMMLNAFMFAKPYDPYPFILLNLILSTLAALQAPVIMMSQNRKEARDRQRAINDYLINLKAEIEIRNVHQKLDLLIAEQMKTLFEVQKVQMDMMEEIRESLNQK